MVNRFMRIMVFFDLPVSTKKKRKEYALFRKALIDNGYTMLQFSVYSRTARNHDDAMKHVNRLKSIIPPEGSVRAMVVTEKQYAGMYLLLGDRLAEETYLDDRDMLEL